MFVPGGTVEIRDSVSGTTFSWDVAGDWITLVQFAKNVLEYDELEKNNFLSIRMNYGKSANDLYIRQLANQVDWDIKNPITACEATDVAIYAGTTAAAPETGGVPQALAKLLTAAGVIWGFKQTFVGGCGE